MKSSQLFQRLQNEEKEASVEDEGSKRRKEGGGLEGEEQENKYSDMKLPFVLSSLCTERHTLLTAC